jgi:nucleoside-diphosphate-sugar epimerase
LVEGIYTLMQSDLEGPTIIGGDEDVTVDELVKTVIDASGREIQIEHVEGPVGVHPATSISRRSSRWGGRRRRVCEKGSGELTPGLRSRLSKQGTKEAGKDESTKTDPGRAGNAGCHSR